MMAPMRSESMMTSVWTVAEETMRRVAAAKATLAFAIAFSVLSLGVSYFGLAGFQASGFQGFGRVTTSLFNLVVYLVPLLALILGTAEVAGRREALALVLAQPVGRFEVLLGSYLGLALALTAALVVGLGSAGALILLQTSVASLKFLALRRASSCWNATRRRESSSPRSMQRPAPPNKALEQTKARHVAC